MTSAPGNVPVTPQVVAPHASAQPAATATGGETPEQALARAQAAAQAKRFGEASGICNDVLAQVPDHPAALALQGIVAALTNDPDRGVGLLQRAIQLRPGNASWYAHLSSLCRITYRLEEAIAAGNESIRLDPNNADHLVNLSLIYVDVDDRQRAMACLLRALGLRHEHADGHLALAQNLLALGEFEPGWIEYEWRNLTEAGKATMPKMTSAPWNGMRIPNGRLLLVGDQGYGDTIQFARYIATAAARCQEVVLGCSAEMGPLLRNLPGVSQYCHRWNDVPGHAAHCRLSSLPYLFHTMPDSIPTTVPYLAADPARIAHWRERFATQLPAGLPRIGLAWTGRPTHPNDRRRSVPLERLLPLADAGTAAFVSLQKPMPARDLPLLGRFNGMIDIADDLTDFGETAAVMENLDLVITVDTAMGHLAGALGRPVWIMIPKAADWRWLLDRTDSPWYPTARLFRQRTPGAWDAVLADVTAALAGRLRAPADALAEPVAAD
ncbi:MAG: tetratricopeptide repeat protein [Acetobacteraceae bacterium]|nr:tetratricopeptide repeat protein [Acetobacteraceae bacterium]